MTIHVHELPRSRSATSRDRRQRLVVILAAVALLACWPRGAPQASPTTPASSEPAVMLVVDRSDAMRGAPIDAVRRGLRAALDRLPAGASFGIVAFDSRAEEIVPLAVLGDRAAARRAIERLAPGSGSDMVTAMTAAARRLAATPGPVRHAVLLAGSTSSSRSVDALIEELEQARITVTVIHLGGDDRALHYRLASTSGGRFYGGVDLSALARICAREIEIALGARE